MKGNERKMTDVDYIKIGKFVEHGVEKYSMAIEQHKKMIHEQNELNHEIIKEEQKENKDVEKLGQLYKQYRILKQDLHANQSFRQFHMDKILSEVREYLHPEDYKNPSKLEIK